MPKIIIKKSNIKGTALKLKIDEVETGSILAENNTIEEEISYGEHTIQMYGNFIGKSVKKKINIENNETKFEITLNFKLWSGISLAHIIMALLILKFPQNTMLIIFPIVIIEFICIVIFGMLDFKEIKAE